MAVKAVAKSPQRALTAVPAGRVYGGRSAVQRRADRRARLLNVGLDLFGTIGFQHTTIPMLCSAAGVTARHFYEDFSSREALLSALYDQISDTMQNAVLAALRAPGGTMHDRIRSGTAAYIRYLTSDLRIARVYVLESRGISEAMEQRRREWRETIIKRLTKATRRLEERGFDTELDSRLVSAALAGAAHDIVLEWILAARRPSTQKMIDTLAALWIRTLLLDAFEPVAPLGYTPRRSQA